MCRFNKLEKGIAYRIIGGSVMSLLGRFSKPIRWDTTSKEVGVAEPEEKGYQVLQKLVSEFVYHFGYNAGKILKPRFIKLFPRWLRPYGRLYAY